MVLLLLCKRVWARVELSYSGSEWEAICWWIYVSQWSTKWIGACSNRISKSEILHFNNKVEKRHKVATLCPSTGAELLKSSSNAISWLNRFQWKLIWISCKFSFFFLASLSPVHLRTADMEGFSGIFFGGISSRVLWAAPHVWWKICIWLILLLEIESEKSKMNVFPLLKSNIEILYKFIHIFSIPQDRRERSAITNGDGWTEIRERRKHFTMDISFLPSIHLLPLHGL